MSLAKFILFVSLFVILYRESKCDCSSNFDCDGSEVCCKPNYSDSVCRDDCIGKSCVFNSDCGGYDEYCCNDTCRKGGCGLAGWVIAVIVLSVLGGIGTIAGVALCYFCSYRRRSPGVIVAHPTVTMPATTVVHAGTSQVNYAHGQMYPQTVQALFPVSHPPPYQPLQEEK